MSYGTVKATFWGDPKVKAWGDDPKMIALYLLTAQHRNIIGCARIPIEYIAADLGWPIDRVSGGLVVLVETKFIERDAEGWTLIVNQLRHDPNLRNDKQVKGAIKAAAQVPPSSAVYGTLRKNLAEIAGRFGVSTDALPQPEGNRIDTVSIPYAYGIPSCRPNLTYPNHTKKDSVAGAARGASGKNSRPQLPGITAPTKYARRLDGGFETASGAFVSFEEAFWELKEPAANRDIGGSMMGALLAAHQGNAGATYDALMLALKKDDPRRYVAGIIRNRETEAQHAKVAANGLAKPMPGDPNKVPQWVLDARGEGETVTWNAKSKYWERAGRGWDDDENEVAF